MKLNDYELMLSDCHVPCIKKSKHEMCKIDWLSYEMKTSLKKMSFMPLSPDPGPGQKKGRKSCSWDI